MVQLPCIRIVNQRINKNSKHFIFFVVVYSSVRMVNFILKSSSNIARRGMNWTNHISRWFSKENIFKMKPMFAVYLLFAMKWRPFRSHEIQFKIHRMIGIDCIHYVIIFVFYTSFFILLWLFLLRFIELTLLIFLWKIKTDARAQRIYMINAFWTVVFYFRWYDDTNWLFTIRKCWLPVWNFIIHFYSLTKCCELRFHKEK